MNWFLTESRILRFASFAIFYIAQGLPIGLLSIALPAWLSEQGAAAGDVAYFLSISTLPWAFKLLAGPIMDRFSFLPMGRRRPWIVFAQIGLLVSVVLLAFVPDPLNNIVLLTWVAFGLNCFVAVQDVAVDGMAIDVLPAGERGRANSFMAFGQVAGYAASGALSALALVEFGLFGAGMTLAVLLLLIFLWGVAVRERRGERLLPWSHGDTLSRSVELQADDFRSIVVNLRLVFFLKASLLLIVITACWRISSGFWLVGAPVIATQDLGFASTQYSYWSSTFSIIAAVLGLLLGPIIDRSGVRKIFIIAMVIQSLLFLVAALGVDYWHHPYFPITVAALEAVTGQAIFISFIAIHMSICWQRVSATQFAIYMAWANFARSIGAGIYGEIEGHLAQGQEFFIMAAIILFGAFLITRLDVARHDEVLSKLDETADPAGRPATA